MSNYVIILANIFGVISIVVFWISEFRKTKKDMVSMYLICNVADVIQYTLLKSPTGVFDCAMSFVRNIAFIKLERKVWSALFIILKVTIVLLFGYEGIITILAVIIDLEYLVALLFLTEQSMRRNDLAKTIYWMIYDFMHMAYISSIFGIGSVIMISMSLYKYRKT